MFEFTQSINFEEYKGNKILRFDIIKNLEIIGEAAYLLTNEF
ncbi:HepT-like ribonuclease domain-containing protein [Butyricimonas faecalis]|nr:HepT-like ribonuclease domain-containing protein [Butyricimonas faecalis]